MRAQPVRLYRPSNGSEGFDFMETWCGHCANDKPWSEGKDFDSCGPEEVCQIIADTMAYSIDDPSYPKQWVYGQDGRPMCLAFEPTGKPYRCPRTIDIFTGKPG